LTDLARPATIPNLHIAVLGLLTIVAYGSWFYGFGVLVDSIAQDYGTGVGILLAGFGLAQMLTGVLGVVAGRLLDRRGASITFAAGAVSGPPLIYLSTHAGTAPLFALCFGLGGGIIGATGFYQVTQSVAARLAPGDESRSIARLTIWGALSSPIMIPLTELARQSIGWRHTLRLGALAVAIVLTASALTVDRARASRSAHPAESPLQAVTAAIAAPDVRRLALSSLAGSFATSVLIVLQVPAMVAAGLERPTAAAMAAARGIAQLFGRLPLGWLLQHVSARRALRLSKALVAVGAVVLVVAGTPLMAAVFVLIAGVSIGAISPLDGIYAREVLPEHDLGTLMGALFLLSGIAAGLGPLAAALLVDLTGITSSGLVLAAAMAALSAAVLRAPDHR
jgi:MFS family permease